MRKPIVIFIVLMIFSGSTLVAKNYFGSISGGYSTTSKSYHLAATFPTLMISKDLKGGMYFKGTWKYKNLPKGFEIDYEPYSWWIPTGEVIYDVFIGSVGYSIDVYGENGMSIIPNIGYGYKTTYTQYKSTATGMYTYGKSEKAMFDYGIDTVFYVGEFGIVLGTSKYSKFLIGALYRY